MNIVIAIDGPGASGKSTVSRALAKRIDFLYLDTGAMYRAVAFEAKRKGIDPKDGKGLRELCRTIDLHFETGEDPPRVFLGQEDVSKVIRSPAMDMLSSSVSSVREVREAMTDLQRKMAKGVNLVAEGRDMGTVVFHDAKHKFFLTATTEVRAKRRYKERLARGESVSKSLVAKELAKRDQQDEMRSLAPLRPARNATIINSDRLTEEQVLQEILDHLGL